MQFIMQCHVGWKYDLCGSEYQKNVCYSMTVHFRISLPGIVSQYDTTVFQWKCLKGSFTIFLAPSGALVVIMVY